MRNNFVENAFNEIESEKLYRVKSSELFCGVEWSGRKDEYF